jgi:hypothetical protein
MFGTGGEAMGLREQNGVLVVDTEIPFCGRQDPLGQVAWN